MKIKEINDNQVTISYTNSESTNLMNNFLVFQGTKTIIGEIINVKETELIVNLVGEVIDNNFTFGVNNKIDLNTNVSLVNPAYIQSIISYPKNINTLPLGINETHNLEVNMSLDNFFNSHFMILGGTGSGKSFSLSTIIQRLFDNQTNAPLNANLLIFDTYGEYENSFTDLENKNPLIKYKSFTTDLKSNKEILKIPPYLLSVDDLALLLNATTSTQIQIIEKALELVNIFNASGVDLNKYKNNIIARAILDILLSGRPSVQIRDQIFSILSYYKTTELNLNTEISQPGYTRALKNCLLIDADGKLREMELLTDFFGKFLIEDKIKVTKLNSIYTLNDLEVAIDFALISEGILKSEKVYDNNNIIKVRIHNLVESEYKIYFDCNNIVTKDDYINYLITKNNEKAQVINFNINYVDDRFAKTIVKIITKMIFDYVKVLSPRGTRPFHLILEEAHRYVMNDSDVNTIGYNIFERIAKEGRKYGILLGLISQRPTELSETVISQCNNFIIFKMTHPKDTEYIYNLIPFMTNDIKAKLHIIKPGTCYLFGNAFKIPILIQMNRPNPTPNSNNINIMNTWYKLK